MENKTQAQSQGKIIIEVQPKGGLNPKTGEPCDGSISIQMKATLSESDRIMVLHALATSFSNGDFARALNLLHTARKLALHTYVTGEFCCDVYEQTPDGTLIDKRVMDALRNKKRGEKQ